MGLFFRKRKRRGVGLFGLLVMVGLMALAVPIVLAKSGSLFTSCQNLFQRMGNMGMSVCSGLQGVFVALNDLTGLASSAARQAQWSGDGEGWRASLAESWQSLRQNMDSGRNWSGGAGASSVVSMDKLREMLGSGALSQGGASYGSASEKLKAAFGSFMAGQSYGGEDDLESQLAWYKNGAGMGEYGILSQLKLGSLYMGTGGVSADYGQAYDYNMQALGSLETLRSSSSPEARAALQALPVEPGQLSQQLQQTLRELQLKQGQ